MVSKLIHSHPRVVDCSVILMLKVLLQTCKCKYLIKNINKIQYNHCKSIYYRNLAPFLVSLAAVFSCCFFRPKDNNEAFSFYSRIFSSTQSSKEFIDFWFTIKIEKYVFRKLHTIEGYITPLLMNTLSGHIRFWKYTYK